MKKKWYYKPGLSWERRKKFLLVFLLNVFLFFGVQAQTHRVTLNVKETSLEQVIKELEKQTGLQFFYSQDKIEKITGLSLQAKQEDFKTILDRLLKHTPLTFTVMDNVVVIKDREKTVSPLQSAIREIKGVVTDVQGNTLPGVTVRIKGTTLGGVTDTEGAFQLSLPEGGTVLLFSFVGMKPLEVVLGDQEFLRVKLEEEKVEMDEVVVTGIFRKAKSSYTGAATVVTGEELKQFGNRNLLTSLRNIDPSFNIVENNEFGSNPNRLPEIQIRGNSSLPNVDQLKDETRVSMNTPLVVLDGFETSLEKLLDINENEVEAITLLKDASATAIYGSRGANGVIVITTKAPAMGKLRVTYRGDLNLEVPDLNSYDVLNACQKLEIEKKAGLWSETNLTDLATYNKILNDINSGVNTDWLSQPLRVGVGHRHNLRLEGGDKTFRYAASIQYNDVQGVMKKSSRRTLNGTLNLSYYYKTLKFTNSLMLGFNKSEESPYGSFNDYVKMNPYYRIYDDSGKLIKSYIRQHQNPLYNALLNTYDRSEYTDVVNNFSIEWQIIPDLLLRGRIGIEQKHTERNVFKPADHTDFADYSSADVFRKGSYRYIPGKEFSYDAGLNLSYSVTFKERHMLYAGLDYNIRQNKITGYDILVEGFNNEDFDFLPMGLQYASGVKPAGSESLTRAIGMTASVNYTYDNRYYIDLSGRTDGASQFGTSRRFAPFWSTGIGWNLHQEKFLQGNPIVNFLKLRASVGITGSQNFDSYQALSTYRYITDRRYYNWMGATMIGLGNEDLQWQQKMNYNVGGEMKLIDNRISLAGDFYIETTKDLVSSVDIPMANGFTSYIENIGKMRNRGYELKATVFVVRNSDRELSWSVTGGLIHNENKILEVSEALQDAQKDLEADQGANPNMLYKTGYSTNTIWVVRSLGIDPSTGRELYLDRFGEPTFTWDSRDLTACGVAEPKYQGNLSTMFRYKGFSANLSFGYRFGGQLYNSTLIEKVENTDFRENVDARVYKGRWQKAGDIAAFKGLHLKDKTSKTSRFVENERVFNCQSVTLQYLFDSPRLKKIVGMENLTLNVSTSDLFYISSVKRERGTAYPFSRQFSFSLSATF